MAKKNKFLEALKTSEKAELPGLEILQDFCNGVRQYVGETIECDALPANHTNDGQEYKVIITYYPSSYSSTLLRAYLNLQGKPSLDVYDKKGPQRCKDLEDFRQKLVEFLSVPGISSMLEQFRRDTQKRVSRA